MANEADLKLIQIPEFPKTDTLVGSGPEYVVLTKSDGVTYGMLTEDFKAFLGTVQVQVPKALAPTDPAPTLSGVYYPTVTQNEAGTPIVYSNAGGIEVNTAEGGEDYGKQVQLIQDNEGDWSKIGIPLPETDLSNLATKAEVATKVPFASIEGTQLEGNQLFDKTKIIRGFNINSSGAIVPTDDGDIITEAISLDPNQSYIRLSGLKNFTHRLIWRDANGALIGSAQQLTTEAALAYRAGAVEIVIWFKNRLEPDDSVLDTFMLNYGTIPLPYEPIRYALESIAGYEVPKVEDFVLKSDVVTVPVSNQKFNKNGGYFAGMIVGSNGTLSPSASQDSLVTKPIALNGASYVAIHGMTGSQNHRIAFWKDTIGSVNSVVSFTGTFGTGERIEEVPPGGEAKYVVVWFRNGAEPDETMQAVLDSFTVNLSHTYLEQDEYKEAVSSVAGKDVLNANNLEPYATKEWVNDNFNSGGLSEAPKRLDDRYRNDFDVKRLVRDTLKYNNTIQSLRKIKSTGSGEKTFTIQNAYGVEKTDVTLVFNVHHGSNEITPTNNDLFMDGLCSTDFSDIRFLDADGNLLDMYKESNGNYEVIPDNRIRTNLALMPDGSLIGTNSETSQGLARSTDAGVTWTVLKNVGNALGGNQSNDIFYSVGNDIYKTTAASGYTDETVVIPDPLPSEALIWRAKSFRMDDAGNLYLGQYQQVFGATIWKSTDGGNTWFKTLDNLQQHVHSINLDRSVVPNIIYANNDGNSNPSSPGNMGTLMSLDRGVTWTKIDYGFSTDSGVLFVGDGYTLGGGEGAIKSQPTIFKRYDDGRVEIKLDVQQNSFQFQRLGNAIYVGASAHSRHRYANIYRSEDEGETWETVFRSSYLAEKNMSWGPRYGLFDTFPATENNEEQLLFCKSSAVNFHNMRIFEGGDHYQGVFYVKVPVLPLEGLTIKVGYGYMAEDIQGDLFTEKTYLDSLVVNLPLNEYGKYVYDNNGNEYKINLENNWIGQGKRFGWMVPEVRPYQTAAVQFSNQEYLTIKNEGQLNFNKGFTLNVWFKLTDWVEAKQFLFGRDTLGNELYFVRSAGHRLGIQYQGNYKYVGNVFYEDMMRSFTMITIVLTDDAEPDFRIFINGGRFNQDGYDMGQNILTGFIGTTDFGDWKLGGLNGNAVVGDKSYFTDFSMFNRVLNDDEVRMMYEGANLVKP